VSRLHRASEFLPRTAAVSLRCGTLALLLLKYTTVPTSPKASGLSAAVAGPAMQTASQQHAAVPPRQPVPASSPLEQRCNLRGKTMAEYVFLGGTGGDLRSRTRVLDFVPTTPEECPVWTYDGSLTNQVS